MHHLLGCLLARTDDGGPVDLETGMPEMSVHAVSTLLFELWFQTGHHFLSRHGPGRREKAERSVQYLGVGRQVFPLRFDLPLLPVEIYRMVARQKQFEI